MYRFKKYTALVLALLLAVSLFGCGAKPASSGHSYSEVYTQESARLNADANGTFRILKINDTHFRNGVCENDEKTLAELKTILDNTPCDLIVMDGDLVEGTTSDKTYDKYQAAAKFSELMESYEIPWTFAPGNNDGEKDGSNEDLIAYLLQYPHFLAGNTEGIRGAMQFFIDVESADGTLIHTVAIMDSLSRKIQSIGPYDSIKENQIEWLLQGVNERKVPASVFFHMPTPAFETAYKDGKTYEGFPFCDEYPVGDIKGNQLFDERTADNPYIALLSAGHVHSDNLAYLYNNRWYQLSSLSGYGAVGSDNHAPSCTLTTVHCLADSTESMYAFEKVSASDFVGL